MVHPHPPVLRALKLAVDRLKQAGMKVVDFDPYDHQEGWDIISTSYFPDGARAQKDLLNASGEPIAELTSWIFSKSRPEPLSVTENWALNVRRDVYRDA
jgi:Asp-tRNA(Asn)/Glu-tRNA(Gln) amidotransferase A subunit family amidase